MSCEREATGHEAVDALNLGRSGVQYGGRLVWCSNSHGEGFTLVDSKIAV